MICIWFTVRGCYTATVNNDIAQDNILFGIYFLRPQFHSRDISKELFGISTYSRLLRELVTVRHMFILECLSLLVHSSESVRDPQIVSHRF